MNINNLKKEYIIGALVFLLVLLITVILAIRSQSAKSDQSNEPDPNVPTAFPISGAPDNGQLLIQTIESDGNSGTLLPYSIVKVAFNRPISSNDFQLQIEPVIATNQTIEASNLYIAPQTNWIPRTTYTLTITAGTQTRTVVFQTVESQSLPEYNENTLPEGAYEESLAFQLANHPDTFLANQTPFATDRFSIIADYEEQPIGHFFFTVVLTGDETEARSYFRVWLESLGMNSTQIDSLDIRYQTQ